MRRLMLMVRGPVERKGGDGRFGACSHLMPVSPSRVLFLEFISTELLSALELNLVLSYGILHIWWWKQRRACAKTRGGNRHAAGV